MLHSTEMMLEVILDDEGEKRPLARLCVLHGVGKTRLSYDYHVDLVQDLGASHHS